MLLLYSTGGFAPPWVQWDGLGEVLLAREDGEEGSGPLSTCFLGVTPTKRCCDPPPNASKLSVCVHTCCTAGEDWTVDELWQLHDYNCSLLDRLARPQQAQLVLVCMPV